MHKLTIDDATYAAWQAQAAACGLDIVEWLKRQAGPQGTNGRTAGELRPEERVELMRAYWSSLKGRGGTAVVDREEIYG